MRIAFVKFRYVPFGGGEGYLELLMGACAARGHEVHLVTSAWPGDHRAGVRGHAVPVWGRTHVARMLSFSRAAGACIRREAFDVSVSLERTGGQDVWRAGEGVHRAWLERRREFEPRWKVWWTERTIRHRTLLALEAQAVRNSRLILANSEMVRRDVETVYGNGHGRIVVVHNGVDGARFSLAGRGEHRRGVRAELAAGADERLLLFVGSGFERKGLAELLRALVLLPEARLAVLGRDDPAPWRRRAARLGLAARVRFLEPQRDLAPYYHAADAAVLPSWFDSFSNVGLEAMLCGTPFVTTRFAGVHELVVPGVNGAVVGRPDAAEELAGALRAQWAAPHPPERAAAIAASVGAFTLEANARRTLAAIESVWEEKQRERGAP